MDEALEYRLTGRWEDTQEGASSTLNFWKNICVCARWLGKLVLITREKNEKLGGKV